VVAIATRGRLLEKVMANIAEVKARGERLWWCATSTTRATKAVADHVLEIPAVPELLSPAVAIVPLQALAYGVARARGNDGRPAAQPRQGRHCRVNSSSGCVGMSAGTGRRLERGRRVIGMGIDAVDVERFRQLLARRPNLAQRIFTDAERSFLSARTDPVPGLAARFAAKEATMKALGHWPRPACGSPRWRLSAADRARHTSRSPTCSQPGRSARHPPLARVAHPTDSVAAAVVVAD